jgi:hypothetical protein
VDEMLAQRAGECSRIVLQGATDALGKFVKPQPPGGVLLTQLPDIDGHTGHFRPAPSRT